MNINRRSVLTSSMSNVSMTEWHLGSVRELRVPWLLARVVQPTGQISGGRSGNNPSKDISCDKAPAQPTELRSELKAPRAGTGGIPRTRKMLVGDDAKGNLFHLINKS